MSKSVNKAVRIDIAKDATAFFDAASVVSLGVDSIPDPVFLRSVDEQLHIVRQILRAKNEAYGNSALSPLRCFSKADTVEQIKVRIDDKLSRMMRGAAAGEDVVLDLLGYLILLRIAERRHD